jgi:hypothetical protein
MSFMMQALGPLSLYVNKIIFIVLKLNGKYAYPSVTYSLILTGKH